jgi:hypothetical protein
MEFRIADTFTSALTKLTRDEQKAAKTSAFDLQTNPTNLGLRLRRIDASKDPNFWSCRVNRDIRIIVHKTTGSLLLERRHLCTSASTFGALEAHALALAVVGRL